MNLAATSVSLMLMALAARIMLLFLEVLLLGLAHGHWSLVARARFRTLRAGVSRQRIDAEVLFELAPEDLTALGVNSIGHRRKLLAAIAMLRAEPSATSERSASVAGPE